MELPTVLRNRLSELKMLQYDMVFCIRKAFEFEGFDFLPIKVGVHSFGRGHVVVTPNLVTRSFMIQNTATADEEIVEYITTPVTLPILQDRIYTHLAMVYLPNIQW